jgi:hypothetical protein
MLLFKEAKIEGKFRTRAQLKDTGERVEYSVSGVSGAEF